MIMPLTDVWYRFVAFVLTAVFLLLPARPEAVALTVTQQEDALLVEYVNNTHRGIEVGGNHFMLEKETDGNWEAIPFREGFGFPAIAGTVVPTDTGRFTVRPDRCFDEPLSPGRYRLTFYYSCPSNALYVGGEQTATVEFDLA